MTINIPGIVSVAVFYVIILIIGIYAGRRSSGGKTVAEIFLANRNMGTVISLFTITATWVGGAFINGAAEKMADKGLAWTQASVGYSTSLLICGLFFAPKLRRSNYVTMFDPFQDKYGDAIGALMCIPHFFADLFWTAAILGALGTTVHIILDLDETMSIIVSAIIAVFYTILGGLWSVAYTDVIQLICIAVGLVLACPFIVRHPSVDLSRVESRWLGEVQTGEIGVYIDKFLLIILGGTTWQELYQRVLACRTVSQARTSTIISGILCLLMSIPPMVIGAAGASADWANTTYTGEVPIPCEKLRMILPLSLQYLCPLPVSIIGLGAISAAVMSSTDSSVLTSASIFTKNIYKTLIRKKASEREMIWVMRVAMVVAGALATAVAILGKSVYGLFVLCSDLMYVILFPQFVSILYIPSINAYGSLIGFIVGFILRVGAGESMVELPPFIHYPLYDVTKGQLFPFRTLIVLITFVVLLLFSWLSTYLFKKKLVPMKFDVLKCFSDNSNFGAIKMVPVTGVEVVNHELQSDVDSKGSMFTPTDSVKDCMESEIRNRSNNS